MNATKTDPKEYDKVNTATVQSSCASFLNYPAPLTFAPVSCSAWGCTDSGYGQWWFSHLLAKEGETNGISNNWWDYIVNPEKANNP